MELLAELPEGEGHVEGILGPMFSQKTTTLLSILECFRMNPDVVTLLYRAQIARPEDKGKVMKHSGGEGEVPVAVVSNASELFLDLTQQRFDSSAPPPRFLVIGLDEAQFVKDLPMFVRWVLKHTIPCHLSKTKILLYFTALDGDFRQKLFPSIAEVLPLCRTFYKRTAAVCMDCRRRQAPFSRRDVPGEELNMPGGAEKYSAACGGCLTNKKAPVRD
jgi:thymidine kinase